MDLQPQIKGLILESAVATIEQMILKTQPGYSDKTFRIERRKLVVVDDVAHEIDIWVQIDLAGGYTSEFIFECKNWNKPVGKNEIIVFEEKIAALAAQRGFFVAHRFTRNAVAKAKHNPRLELIKVRENNPITNPLWPVTISQHRHVIGRLLYTPAAKSVKDYVSKAVAHLDGAKIDFEKHISQWVDNLVDKVIADNRNLIPSQCHCCLFGEQRRTFEHGRFVVNDCEITEFHLKVQFEYESWLPRIVGNFDAESRGRVYVFEAPDFHIYFAPPQPWGGSHNASGE